VCVCVFVCMCVLICMCVCACVCECVCALVGGEAVVILPEVEAGLLAPLRASLGEGRLWCQRGTVLVCVREELLWFQRVMFMVSESDGCGIREWSSCRVRGGGT
jgi:hypothetical protein